jgi:hypothetical protein
VDFTLPKDSTLNNKNQEVAAGFGSLAFDLTDDRGSKTNILTEVGNLTKL